MNRLAKGFRVGSAIFVLLNIVAFFLPMSQRIQENYGNETWSQLDYLIRLMGTEEPYSAEFTTMRLIWAVCLIVLPLLLVVATGVWGIAGDERQIGSCILSFVILALYVGLFITISMFFPEEAYVRGIAGAANLLFSGIGSLFAIIALIATPEKEDELVMTDIPQIMEMKQEQIEAKYNIISEGDEPTESLQDKRQRLKQEQEEANYNLISEDDEPTESLQDKRQRLKQEQMEAEFTTIAGDDGPTEVLQDILLRMQQEQISSQNVPEQMSPTDNTGGSGEVKNNEPRGVMVGLTGMYTGAEIPFANGERIKLGRLTDNDLIFDDQEKVSRNHCYISWDANKKKFTICDFSSNGTFVNGSNQCIPQNLEISLEPGSIIAIGDERNTFRLE